MMRWHRPAPALRPYVGAYIGYRTEPGPPGVHQGVPSGHLTFLLCLDGKVEVLANPDPARPPGTFAAMVAGLHDRPAQIAQGAAQTGLQVALTWRGARALFGVPAAELAGDTVDLAALLGRRAGPLLERVAEASTWEERFARLDQRLTALVDPPAGGRGTFRAGGVDVDDVRPEIGWAWDRLESSGGTARVADVAREVGWSRRHLAEQLRRETGLTPKTAARVIRFGRACDRLRSPARPALATVAADCGYVDQSHLSRDFRDLAAQTATEWLAERPA